MKEVSLSKTTIHLGDYEFIIQEPTIGRSFELENLIKQIDMGPLGQTVFNIITSVVGGGFNDDDPDSAVRDITLVLLQTMKELGFDGLLEAFTKGATGSVNFLQNAAKFALSNKENMVRAECKNMEELSTWIDDNVTYAMAFDAVMALGEVSKIKGTLKKVLAPLLALKGSLETKTQEQTVAE